MDHQTIQTAFFTTPESNQVALVFSNAQNGLMLTPNINIGGNIRTMADAFFINDTIQAIRTVKVISNAVIIDLNASFPGAQLSYIPDQNYAGTSVIYEGPWITNRRGLGAFSFHRFSILPFGTTTAVPQQSITVKKLDLR